jgi:hypothetical protein
VATPRTEDPALPFSRFDRYFSKDDRRILELAYLRACHFLDRDPEHSSHADRLARTIITFFDQGQRDFGRLAGMAVKREVSMSKVKEYRNALHYAPMGEGWPMQSGGIDKHLN